MKLYDLFEQQKPLNQIQSYSSQGEFIDKGVSAYNSGGLPMLYRYIENQLGFKKEDVEKDFLPTKAEHSREDDAVMAFLGELESMAFESKKSTKQVNPVAKHSRNKSGAGAHKSAKDYDRKDAKKEIDDYIDNRNMGHPDGVTSDEEDKLHGRVHKIREKSDGMIGEPDNYYDAEERKEAYDDLQTALDGVRNDWEKQSVIDGVCPECSGTSYMDGDYDNDEDSCYGWGNYGCDQGEMENASWVEIIKFDQQNVDRQKAKANYPGDEEVIKQAAKMMPNMDDPRMIVQQLRTDYPQLGRAKASDLAAKAKQIAFPESVEIDQIKKLAGLNELKDKRTDIQKIEDLLKDAIGPENSGGDMYELYAELESMDSEKADEVKLIAKEMYNVRLEEGKSPHKKGSAKYKKHMAAMHAEDLEEKALKDVGGDDIVTVKMGGVDREFIRKGDEWESTDQKNYPMKFKVGTPTHDKLLNIQRKKQMARSTPSAQARRKLKVMASEAEYQGKDVELNKPKRGGSKKYYVYVKTPKGNVKKISFGDVTGLKAKAGNKKAAKSFAARHNCEKKNDKQKAGYWACRLPRYGLVKGGKWW